MATNRLSLTFTTYVHPPDKITDVVQYLHGEKRTIIPYRTTISEACGVDGYAGIAQYSGNSLRYTYFNNFLLSEMVEAKYEMDRTWDHNPTTRLEGILSLPEDAAILVNEESSAEFLGTLEQIPETERRTVRTFNHYLLYE